MEFLSFKNQKNLISGVILHKLVVNRDPRGFLMETMKETWKDVFSRPDKKFGQSYCSVTLPGYARDEDSWHNHPARQIDRFVVVKGNAVFALYDWREDSETKGLLNLFIMGEMNGDDDQYLLFIPHNVLHGFCTVGKEACFLLGNPTEPYDPREEGRVLFKDVGALFEDGSPFSWQAVREHFAAKP